MATSRKETRYAVDPVELAVQYRELGARWLHVVDLDGAKRGEPVNLALIRRMQEAAGVDVQLGGGIRTRASLEQALEVATRAVIGSLAVSDPELVAAWLTELGPDRLTLALDVRLDADGHAADRDARLDARLDADAGRGDRSLSRRPACATCSAPTSTATARSRARTSRCTSECVSRWPAIEFQASGGVRDVADLAALTAAGVAATVSGKALLEGRLKPEEIRPFLRGA